MSPRIVLALLAGAGVGVGVLLVVVGLRGGPAPAPARWRVGTVSLRRGAAGVAAALAVAAVTRWLAVAVGIGVLVAGYDRLFGGIRRNRLAVRRLEALAGWAESLRDMVASGIALPEALPASAAAAAPAIRPQLAVLTEALAAREPVEVALRAMAEEFDDGAADLLLAALILNVRAQGRALDAVLSALAASTRDELRVRRTIDAERRSTRRAVQIVVAVTVTSALGLAVGNPSYVAPYRTAAGQLVLVVVVAVFGAAFWWLARLSAAPAVPRLLRGDAPVTGGRP